MRSECAQPPDPEDQDVTEKKKMMKGPPIKASDVAASSDKTPEEFKQERVMQAVRGRMAKQAALRNAGADVPPPSGDLAASVELGLKNRERKVMDSHKLHLREMARREVARRTKAREA